MNKRQFLTTLALSSLAPFCSGQSVSDSGDTILKLIKNYKKFDYARAHYFTTFADAKFLQHVQLKFGEDYKEIISFVENHSGFESWKGIDFFMKPEPVYITL
jgi:hypothetical protein